MAKNIRVEFLQDPMTHMDLVVTSPTTDTTNLIPASGTAVLAGRIPGVAEATVDPVTGFTPVCTNCIAELAVKGIGGSGNAAINASDLLYYHNAGTTAGTIDKNSANSDSSAAVPYGTAFGNALTGVTGTDTRTGQLVASGATTTIRVWVGKIN